MFKTFSCLLLPYPFRTDEAIHHHLDLKFNRFMPSNNRPDLILQASTDTPLQPPSSSTAPSNKSLRNKRRKAKYRQKKKLQQRKKQPRQPAFQKITSKRQWSWKVLRTPNLTLQQKRKLFTIHKLFCIKEQNLALIHTEQAKLLTCTFKNDQSIVTTTTKSTSSTVSDVQMSISILKSENDKLQHRISSLKISECKEHKLKINVLIRTNRNHGHILQKRIRNLNFQLRTFNTFYKQRSSLIPDNLANILELDEHLQRNLQVRLEEEKLNTVDKIHNFTATQLPLELKDLLNKGTNFIPTLDHTETKHFKKTINTEINQALCTVIKQRNPSVGKLKAKKSSHRFQPYSHENPHKLLKQELNRPHFNLHIVDYVHNTTTHTKHFLQRPHLNSLLHRQHTNITPDQFNYIQQLKNDNDMILTMTDKNMGWALVPISWFQNEYNRHFSDNETYQPIDKFDLTATTRHSNTILRQLTARFKTNLLADRHKRQLLYCVNDRQLQLPFMKLLPKVHKLDNPASTTNLPKLTGRPIITAHSWITSNPSRLLGQELDSIILQLKTYFDTHNIPFPLIYNSSELLDKLQQTYIEDITSYSLTTFDFTSLYTNISYHNTIQAIITSCNLLHLPNLYRDYLLNLNNFINQRNFFRVGNSVYQQTKGVAMGSYHSRQIADLVLLLSEFRFFDAHHPNNLFIFCRYIDDGFMLTSKAATNDLITKLCAAYPTQIPITFSSSTHSVNYLDLTISLNHHTIRYHRIHYQVFQKPHHKYMYPHYSSNHPQHIFSGIIKTETTRYSRLSKTIDDYNYLCNLFRLRLQVLDYPDKLITTYSFPWLSFAAHKRLKTKRLQQTDTYNNTNPTVYYRTKYNKHMRTDKIVQKLLHKYHNNHIPKLSKAYCNSTKLHTLLLTNRELHRKLILTTNPHTC